MKIRLLFTCLLPSLPLLASPPGGHSDHGTFVGVHSLDVISQGGVVDMLTGEYPPHEARAHLYHQRSQDGGQTWSGKVRVDAGLPQAHMPHRGMDAQIAAVGDKLVAVWMTPGTDRFGGGPMATALSTDGGKTWQAGPNPADDGSTTGHGFIDLAADAGGQFHLTWFDTRREQRGLRYAKSSNVGKSWSANQTADPETCECCWNVIAAAPDGTVAILYRDKAPRDMSLALLKSGASAWQSPVRLGSFGWEFEGCPHVGGGLAVAAPSATQPARLHAMVWNGQPERLGIYHVATGLDGSTTAPQPLGDAQSSHPDLATGVEGRLAAVWNARVGETSVIAGALSHDGGKSWVTMKNLSLNSPGVTATHPKVVFTGGEFRVFWTENEEGRPSVWRSRPLVTRG